MDDDDYDDDVNQITRILYWDKLILSVKWLDLKSGYGNVRINHGIREDWYFTQIDHIKISSTIYRTK